MLIRFGRFSLLDEPSGLGSFCVLAFGSAPRGSDLTSAFPNFHLFIVGLIGAVSSLTVAPLHYSPHHLSGADYSQTVAPFPIGGRVILVRKFLLVSTLLLGLF